MYAKILMVAFAAFSIQTLAHEGHGIPGALPPAPHGGVVAEVEEPGGHHHEGKEEKEETELFFEATYKNKEISVYALTFPKGSTATFEVIPAKKNLSGVSLKVEFPRAKKFETLKPTVTDEAIKAPFDAKSTNRIIVHVTATHGHEEKVAKIQIEMN